MTNKIKLILPIFILLMVFSSCRKVEGPGGSVTIKGVVIERNHVGTSIFEYPAADQDVYIIYGSENSFYDDDVSTSYDGSFEFRYLQKGDYQIFAYQDNPSVASGTDEVLVQVNASENNQVILLDTIYIDKY
ncbi:MAG: hypothetical protein DBW72_06775 [Flavobacteriales bacterium]|nr:MAG: hypothetical protein DBW72_06775 [Flavobacteriales bacterium]